jgi:hypothetical protein
LAFVQGEFDGAADELGEAGCGAVALGGKAEKAGDGEYDEANAGCGGEDGGDAAVLVREDGTGTEQEQDGEEEGGGGGAAEGHAGFFGGAHFGEKRGEGWIGR